MTMFGGTFECTNCRGLPCGAGHEGQPHRHERRGTTELSGSSVRPIARLRETGAWRERRTVVSLSMDLTDDERDLLLRGLFELTITYVEDDQLRAQAKALALRLGGDTDEMFYGATPGEPPP
jgi:hypothetical protein